MIRGVRAIFCLMVLLMLSACATYQDKVGKARDDMKSGNYDKALTDLQKLAETDGRDQLAYVMDYAAALEFAGRYKESSAMFEKAGKLVDLNDYHSATNIALSALTSEEMIQYKGESYEKILINAFASLDYLMEGKPDDAVVEARRINEKVLLFRQKDRPNYEQNPFGSYLSALIWEGEGKFDDAYIAYEDSYKLGNQSPFIGGDLIRSAKKARREDAYKKWKKTFPTVTEDPQWYDHNMGEVVLVMLQGWGPRKFQASGPILLPGLHGPMVAPRVPELRHVPSITTAAKLELNGVGFNSLMVYDLESAAITTLKADFGYLLARRAAGVATKAVIADQIRQKNELLGLVAGLALGATDRADLRQWSVLPQTIQLARAWVPAGEYKASALGLNIDKNPDGEQMPEQTIKVQAGHKTFLVWKSLR